jgi:uncharacterized membrane protein YGL010W
MTTIHQWLDQYAESHQNPLNILIHWWCVPIIFWSISGFLFLVTLPVVGNLAIPVLVVLTIYYLRITRLLWLGLLLFATVGVYLNFLLFSRIGIMSAWVYLTLFVIAWILQFYGHYKEGKKPSFLKDLHFLIIGPAWLMAKIYKRMKLPI